MKTRRKGAGRLKLRARSKLTAADLKKLTCLLEKSVWVMREQRVI